MSGPSGLVPLPGGTYWSKVFERFRLDPDLSLSVIRLVNGKTPASNRGLGNISLSSIASQMKFIGARIALIDVGFGDSGLDRNFCGNRTVNSSGLNEPVVLVVSERNDREPELPEEDGPFEDSGLANLVESFFALEWLDRGDANVRVLGVGGVH